MIINLKSQSEMSGLYIIYTGSVHNERKGIYGIAHLMEHLFFKSIRDLEKQFEKYGIETNAYTNSNEVVFYATGLEKYLSKFRDEFFDKITKLDITDDDFQKERNVVVEEYGNNFNDQQCAHWHNFVRKKYGWFSPVGLKEDLLSLTIDDCRQFNDLQFAKPSKVISVSKDYVFNREMEFQGFDNKIFMPFSECNAPVEKTPVFEDKTSILDCMPVYGDFAHIQFVCRMLCYGLQSPLFKRLREDKGLVYGVGCSIVRMSNISGLLGIDTITANENVQNVQNTMLEVMSDKDSYLNEERFDTAKIGFEIDAKMDEINRYANVKKCITPYEWQVYSILDGMNMKRAWEIGEKYFDFEKWYKSEDKKEFV